VSLFALTALALTTSPASANAPTTTPLNFAFTGTVPADALCPFDVDISAVGTGTERDYTDRDGRLTRIEFHFVEQDTFSANGHVLVGDPFVNVQHGQFDENGNLIHFCEVGVIERVPLPHGTAFLSAGRVDFVDHGFSFVFIPDRGHSGNLEAFCAALAP
jgi:hypothetical protein